MARKTPSAKKSVQIMSKEVFRQLYNELVPKYERLAVNLQQAIKAFLGEKSIPFLDVVFRVKDADSAYEKIGRKEFESPFEQIEDWCGLRIICYYPSDVEKICIIIKDEFDIISQEDTAKRLALKEFGYRSTHFILKVKESWMQPPNYRGLRDFRALRQVRTILMHAWAEVEHKLKYKSAEEVPEQFQRKLYLLSAKFEEADGQFEELRDGITKYRTELSESVKGIEAFIDKDFNLDTLQAYLNLAFPDRENIEDATSDVFTEFAQVGLSMSDLVNAYESANKFLPTIEEAWREGVAARGSLTQVGAIRALVEVTNADYQKFRNTNKDESGWGKGIEIVIKELHKQG